MLRTLVLASALGLVATAAVAADSPQKPAAAADSKSDVKKDEKVDAKKGEKTSDLPAVTVDELATLLDKTKTTTPVAVFDVNGADTRSAKGVIPGAVLLPGAAKYDLGVLPKQKDATLVFYCANERCGASHTAAKRALEAGFKTVKILPAGIEGWVSAGKPVTKQPVG